jgi:plasmid maintenance system antidote protein VapI
MAIMGKRRPKTKLSDEVRKAIDDSGESRYAIAKATGIDESALGKFYNGQRGITTDTLDRLAEHLKLRIVMDRKPKSKGK